MIVVFLDRTHHSEKNSFPVASWNQKCQYRLSTKHILLVPVHVMLLDLEVCVSFLIVLTKGSFHPEILRKLNCILRKCK